MLITIIIIVSIILINVVFGYWRANTRKLSLQWIMAIHIPVPIAISLRLLFLGWNWLMLPLFVGAFAAGQFTGGRVRGLLKEKQTPVSSFLIKDLFSIARVRKEKEKTSEKS